jgi:hypothetical protein
MRESFIWGPLLPAFKIFGSNQFFKTNGDFHSISRFWEYYTIVILIFLLCQNIFLGIIALPTIDNKELLANTFGIVNLFGYGLSCITGNLDILVNNSALCYAINKIIFLKKELIRLRFSFRIKSEFFFWLFIIFLLEFFIDIILFLLSFFTLDFEDWVPRLIYIFMNKVVFSLELSFLIYVYNIKFLLEWINFGVVKIQTSLNFEKLTKLIQRKTNLKDLNDIKMLRLIYSRTCEVSEIINKPFSNINLVNIALDFAGLVYSVHTNGKKEEERTLVEYGVIIYWFSFFLLKLILKLKISSRAMFEVNMKIFVWHN